MGYRTPMVHSTADGKTVIRARLHRKDVETKPYLTWNAFLDVIIHDYRELSAVQLTARLVFDYDSEVQNGGHFQYFENGRLQHIDETVDALAELGATEQREVLLNAVEIYRDVGQAEWSILTAEQFCDGALRGDYDNCDRRYYECRPDMQALLERYLKAHLSDFVEIA